MRALALAMIVLAAGCVATADFHSKNGQKYPALTDRAVQCSRPEGHKVLAAGGIVIGTIDGKGITTTSTSADVIDKAAQVAADRGGTHLVLTDEGIDEYTTTTPATVNKHCTEYSDGTRECDKTYQDGTTTTDDRPTARFLVIRLAPEAWRALPPDLRPAAR